MRGVEAAQVPISSGFLIVKRFETLYTEFLSAPKFRPVLELGGIYALPRSDVGPERASVQYRGLDRDALSPYDNKEGRLAEIRMAELQGPVSNEPYGSLDVGVEDFLQSERDAREVLGWADEETPGEYEIVWARLVGTQSDHPDGYDLLGYEPTYFVSDHFSVICDCMCFPRWHGTDNEGELFRPWFDRLNKNGLFDAPDVAEEFLKYYLSFDWTEHVGDYFITEVWAGS